MFLSLSLIFICIYYFTNRSPSVFATPEDKYFKILPNSSYSPEFDRDVIRNIVSGICRQKSHIIRFVVDDNNSVPQTAQNILHDIEANCNSALVEVMHNSVFRRRSEAQYLFKLSVFVFVLSNWTQFKGELLYRRLESKGLQRYIFVVEERVEESTSDWLHDMMAQFWAKQILNVVVIFSKVGGKKMHWFTYTPFARKEMKIELVEMNSKSDWFFDKLQDIGRNELVVTMNNDEVRALPKKKFETEGFTGVDGMLADLIRERLNATFVYVNPLTPYNGSKYSGTCGDLVSHRAQFSFNAETYLRWYHENVIEPSNSFERSDICILLPKGAPEPKLCNLWHTLDALTWGATIACIAVMVTVYYWLQSLQLRISRKTTIERRNFNALNILSIHFQSFLGDSITSLPTSMTMRNLIVSWCFFSFLMNTAFTAKLVSSLVSPRYLADIDTLNELSTSSLKIVYPDFVSTMIFADDRFVFDTLRDQFHPVPYDRLYAMIKEDRSSSAYVMAHYETKFHKINNIDPTTSTSFYHIMQECLMYSSKIYPIEQGSAYVLRINELLSRFHEMGFIVKWERDTNHRDTLNGKISDEEMEEIMEDSDEGPKVVLTVSHLQSAFYLLGVGLMLSGVIFAGEILWINKGRKINKLRL